MVRIIDNRKQYYIKAEILKYNKLNRFGYVEAVKIINKILTKKLNKL
jgi:hypothetical protein